MLQTERLILRQWREEDFQPFAHMCQDKEVMAFFPKLQSTEESFAMAARIQALIQERGWGLWAVEVPGEHPFIGFVGLHTPKDSLPFSPCVEIGWRLSKHHWRKGYATEAATAALQYAFTELNLKEVVSFTTRDNTPSQAVMKKIGMVNSGQHFLHPDIERSHPQCEHVLFTLSKQQWQQANR